MQPQRNQQKYGGCIMQQKFKMECLEKIYCRYRKVNKKTG